MPFRVVACGCSRPGSMDLLPGPSQPRRRPHAAIHSVHEAQHPEGDGEEKQCELIGFTVFKSLHVVVNFDGDGARHACKISTDQDRKSTRLNSSHVEISYAVFCLKKKKHAC